MSNRMWIDALKFAMALGISTSSLAQTSGPTNPTPTNPNPSSTMQTAPGTITQTPGVTTTPAPGTLPSNSMPNSATGTTMPGTTTTQIPPVITTPNSTMGSPGIATGGGISPNGITTGPVGVAPCPCSTTTPAGRAPVGGCNC